MDSFKRLLFYCASVPELGLSEEEIRITIRYILNAQTSQSIMAYWKSQIKFMSSALILAGQILGHGALYTRDLIKMKLEMPFKVTM